MNTQSFAREPFFLDGNRYRVHGIDERGSHAGGGNGDGRQVRHRVKLDRKRLYLYDTICRRGQGHAFRAINWICDNLYVGKLILVKQDNDFCR